MCLGELSGRPAGPFCVHLIPTPLRTASRSRPAAQNPRLGDPAACWLFNASPRSRLCSADLQKPSKTLATRTGKRHRAPPLQGLARSRGTAREAEAWPRALPLAGRGERISLPRASTSYLRYQGGRSPTQDSQGPSEEMWRKAGFGVSAAFLPLTWRATLLGILFTSFPVSKDRAHGTLCGEHLLPLLAQGRALQRQTGVRRPEGLPV